MKVLRSASLLLAVLCICALAGRAQTATAGAVLGTVFDPQGGRLPKAQVTLTNTATNTQTTAQTNSVGLYTFPTVTPGTYDLTVSMPGFRTSTVTGVKVEVNTSATMNLTLAIGSSTQSVDVVSNSGQVALQTTDSTIGDVIGPQALAQLPTRLRQAQELTFLQPGTTPTNGGDSGGSVGGAVNDQTTFTYDGIDISDNETNSTTDSDHGARPVLIVSVEAVDEFRVGVSNSNSTFNKASGGQVTLIGKSGSNKFNGSLFSYLQNSAFNANTWDNNHLHLVKPHVEDNRFGGYLGGPIIKDKLFFFTEYEARRYPETFKVTAVVPTPTLASGVLQFKDGTGAIDSYNLATASNCGALGIAPCDARGLGISPTMKAMMAADPAGNDPGLSGSDGLNTTGFAANAKTPLKDDFGTFRLDYNLTSKWHLNASFSYSRDLAYDSAPIVLDIRNPNDVLNEDFLPNWTNAFILGVTGQLTPNITNSIHIGDVRNRNGALRPQLSAIAGELQLPGTGVPSNGYVAVTPDVFAPPISMSNTVRTQVNDDLTVEGNDDVTWVKHNHILQIGISLQQLDLYHIHTGKVGGSVNSLNATETADSSFLSIVAADRPKPCPTSTSANCLPSGSSSTWDSLYATTLGMMNDDNAFIVRNQSATAEPIGTSLIMNSRAYYASFYGQDTWRVTPALTLTYGLSYGWQTPYNFSNQAEDLLVNASTLQPLSPKTYLQERVIAAEAGDIYNPPIGFLPVAKSGRSSVYNTDYGDVAPRIAVAWNPSHPNGLFGKILGVEKTVIRGGFGMYYDRLNGELAVVNPGLAAGPSSSATTGLQPCTASGTPGGGCNSSASDPGLSDFRIGVDGTIPLPSYATTLASPYIPANGYSELASAGIDINYKSPRVYSSNLTVQRDIGHGAVAEVAWTGRYGRRLEGNVELNASPYMFADTTSGQSFAQAFDAVANALRAGGSVTTQPWFENQLPGVGASHGYASTTAYLAAIQASNFENGNVSSIFDSTGTGLNFLRQSIGMQAYDETSVNDLGEDANVGFSNYNAFIATFRRSGKNLTLDINYTLSKSLDTNQGVANDSTDLANPLNPGIDYGPSHFDRRNTLNSLFIYSLPKTYSIFPTAVNQVLGGWHVSGIITAVSGLPLYVTEGSQVWGGGQRSAASTPAVPLVNVKTIHAGVNTNNAGSGGIGNSGGSTGINLFVNPAAVHNDFGYVQLSSGMDGYKAPLRGLAFLNTDASVGKTFPIHERLNFELAADAFNLFNNVTFNAPSLPFLGSSVSSFGVMTSTLVPENRQASSRWVMLSGRLNF